MNLASETELNQRKMSTKAPQGAKGLACEAMAPFLSNFAATIAKLEKKPKKGFYLGASEPI